MVALFIVPNVVVVSAVEFDMNKYFQIMWIAVAILAAWLIRRWPRPVIAAVLLVSALSPALIGIWHLRSTDVALSLAAGDRGATGSPRTRPSARSSSPTPTSTRPVDLAGRLRISTFGPYVANLGYDPDPRAADTTAIYCDGPEVAADTDGDLRRDLRAVERRRPVRRRGPGRTSRRARCSRRSTTSDGVTIWRLAGP